MNRKISCIWPCVVIVALLSGCWSQREPKNLSMVNSVLYDRTEDGKSRLIVEIMHPTGEAGGQGRGGGGEKTSSLTIVCTGLSMPAAIREETKNIDKVLFGGQNQARLFSEKLARKGVGSVVDFLMRDHLTDETPLMVLVQGEEPDRIYQCSTGLSSMLGDYLGSLSETQHLSTCQSVFVTNLAFSKDYYDDGKQPVMGLAKIMKNDMQKSEPKDEKSSGGSSSGAQEGASGKDLILYEGLAAFKDDKLAGFMNGVEARAYNILTGRFTVDSITIPSGEEHTTCMLRSTKAKIDTKINQDKQAEINIQVKAVLGLIQEGGDIDISKSDELKKMEQEFSRALTQQIEEAVKKAQQEFESDIFGFGHYVHSQHPKEWKEIKKDWDIGFSKAKIHVNVTSSIVREGEIKMPFVLKEKTDE